jgi:hypothetical protein
MTGSAFCFYQRIRDGNTGLTTWLSLTGNNANPTEHAIEQRKGGKQRKYDNSATDTFPAEW